MIVRTIATKEMLDQISSPKFIFLFIVTTLLILLSLYTGSGSYVSARDEYQATQGLSQREMDSRQTYQDFAGQGVKVARPPAPLSSIAGGLSSALGRSARVRPTIEPELAPPPVADTPIVALLGQLDLSVVVRIFLSLFVLLLTYDAVSGEKEAGTLKAILANPIPRAQLLMGKALGLFGTLLIATAVPAILGLLVMKVGFRIELSLADWARLGAIAASAGLYLFTVFAMGLFVSTSTSRSSLSFLVLLLIWVAFVEVIPKASTMVARQFRPTPSIASVQSDRDRLQSENLRAMMQNMQNAMQQAAFGSPASSPEEADARQHLFDSLQTRSRDSLTADLQGKLASLEEAQRNKKDAFTRLALIFARISPAEALNHAAAALAGTDFESEHRWTTDLLTYRGQLEQYLRAKGVTFGRFVFRVSTNTRAGPGGGSQTRVTGGGLGGDQPAGRLELGDFPKFRAQAEPILAAFGRAAPDLVILGLYASIAFMLAFAKFMRYDVR